MNKTAQKPQQKKSRWHFIETYHSPGIVEKFLADQQQFIVHYAYAKHDKDIFTEGEKKGLRKEPHIHLLLYLTNTRAITTVQNWLDAYKDIEYSNTRVPDVCGDPGRAFSYLTHRLNPEKYQYTPDVVRSDDFDFWFTVEARSLRKLYYPKEADDGLVQMFDDLVAGRSTYDMVHKWGKAYIVNSGYLRALYQDFMLENNVMKGYRTAKKAVDVLDEKIRLMNDRLEDLKGKYQLSCHEKFAELNSALQIERTKHNA